MMLSIQWLPNHPLHAVDNVSTPVFHRAMVIVIASHILESEYFPLPISYIIWHASNELLDAIPVFEAWVTLSGVFFLQHIVIVRPHALLLDPTLDIFELFTRHKGVVRTFLEACLKATLSVALQWLSDVIALRSCSTVVCFHQSQRWWRRFGQQVCDVFNVFKVGKHIQPFDWTFSSVEFAMLSEFNPSRSAANC